MNEILANVYRKIRESTRIERIVISIIILFVAVLLLTEAQWVSDGAREFRVRVSVFNAATGMSVEHAEVAIVNSYQMEDTHNHYQLELSKRLPGATFTRTDRHGIAVIPHQFRTSASNRHPDPRSHLAWAWVVVKADHYGGIATPIRYQSESAAAIKKAGAIPVAIGLLPTAN